MQPYPCGMPSIVCYSASRLVRGREPGRQLLLRALIQAEV